jgi:hypothetical protein
MIRLFIDYICIFLNPSDRVAQLVERRSSNSKVAGSRNYIIHTLEHFHLNIYIYIYINIIREESCAIPLQ